MDVADLAEILTQIKTRMDHRGTPMAYPEMGLFFSLCHPSIS